MRNIKISLWGLLLGLTGLWVLANLNPPASPSFIAIRNLLVHYTGVLGIGVMSVAMILATRPLWLEPYLGGLDKSYRLHKWLGITALIAAVVHWLGANGPRWLADLGLRERGGRRAGPDPETLFVACQRYLVAVTARAGVKRKQALDVGPRLHGGNTVVSIINAAANAWKHESEWLEEGQRALNDGREEPQNRRRDQALDALDGALGEYAWEYKLANALYALCGEIAFSPLMSRLTAWRDALFADQHSPSSE